jgi:hypothetical protein
MERKQAANWAFIVMQWIVSLIIMGAAICRVAYGWNELYNFLIAFYLL